MVFLFGRSYPSHRFRSRESWKPTHQNHDIKTGPTRTAWNHAPSDSLPARRTPRTATAEAEIRRLAGRMKIELQSEYERVSPERVQRRRSMFEIIRAPGT